MDDDQQRFIALEQGSQYNGKTILYFDNHAKFDDLYGLAVARLDAAYELLDQLSNVTEYSLDVSKNVSFITKLLISDGLSILKYLYKNRPKIENL